MNSLLRISAIVLLPVSYVACTKPPPPVAVASAAKHEHHAPHGGTAVVLGSEAYHLELVLDVAAGKLTAFVLDGEMENFVRTKAASFEVIVNAGAEKRPLVFRALSNAATGESVGDTAAFEAQADWLKTGQPFDAVLSSLEIRGTTFANVAFNFPRGNDKD